MRDAQDRTDWLGLVRGDQTCFSSLYLKYHPLLLRYGTRLVGDAVEAEEAVQELFIYLFERRDTLSIVERVKPYLFLSFRRRLLQKISKKRSYRELKQEGELKMHLSQEDLLIAREEGEIEKAFLKKMLSELTSNQREVIYLRYYADLTNKEIAELLGMRHQSILNILYRSFQKLRRLLEKSGERETLLS